MRSLVNGRKLLAGAFLGLVGLAGAMAISEPPRRPQLSDSSPAASQEQAELAKTDAASAPVAQPSPEASPVEVSDDPFVIKRILPINGPIRYGEWHWDDAGVPDGPIVVTVDLDARVLSIFRGGYEIGATAVLLGTQDHPTPTGVFPIMQKRRHHTSNLYDAEMPYMQRLTNDGITLHATEVEWGYASHGCIGMPEQFAAKVFATTKIGDKVYITRGKTVGMGDSLVDS
ncbi:MAG: L,D-transpeptidase family protein [Novosphingobium sp.]|nr:L,D-transpeptidase family protein [Novosphingobium sp.]